MMKTTIVEDISSNDALQLDCFISLRFIFRQAEFQWKISHDCFELGTSNLQASDTKYSNNVTEVFLTLSGNKCGPHWIHWILVSL